MFAIIMKKIINGNSNCNHYYHYNVDLINNISCFKNNNENTFIVNIIIKILKIIIIIYI